MSDNKFKKFLIDGFQTRDRTEEEETEVEGTEVIDETTEPVAEEEETVLEEVQEPEPEPDKAADELVSLRAELDEIKSMLAEMKDNQPALEMPDMSNYLTNKEQLKAVTHAVEKKDASTTNKNLVRAMEQISVMREDFFKLCQGMRKNIDKMSAQDVLSSFEAYEVDMENILVDGGVVIGPFPFDKLNTLHQRIVDVIPTDDEAQNGMIAERLSDGYKIGDKVLLKEKVKIYKFTETAKAEADSESGEETPSETVSTEENTDIQEEKE